MNAQAAHSLSSLERFPSRLAARQAENSFSIALATMRALSKVDRVRAMIDLVTDADFEDLGVPETRELDALLDKILTAAEADRSVGGWAL